MEVLNKLKMSLKQGLLSILVMFSGCVVIVATVGAVIIVTKLIISPSNPDLSIDGTVAILILLAGGVFLFRWAKKRSDLVPQPPQQAELVPPKKSRMDQAEWDALKKSMESKMNGAMDKTVQTANAGHDQNNWGGVVFMGFVVVIGGWLMYRSIVSDLNAPPKPESDTTAFVACEMAIKGIALDKSQVEVPRFGVEGQKRSDGTWEFYWGATTRPLRMPNKLGMSLIAEGICIANRQGRVISLVIDGNKVM